MEEKPLRPRFSIHKSRIHSDTESGNAKENFEPDKVVYIEIDDEITAVFDRVRRVRGKKIALVIPKRAVVLQSIVNLRILKKKLDEIEKEIVIVTSDLPGLQLAEKVGIPAVEKLFDKEPEPPTPPPSTPRVSERPVRISKEKVSIAEVIRKDKSDFFTSLLWRLKERIKKKRQEAKANETRLVFIAPNKQALFTLILVSVFLLLAIAYIALPGATIYLTPKSTVLDPSFNVTFLDYEKNRDIIESNALNTIVIPTYPVRPPAFTKKIIHPATGKIFKGENARGVITVINLSTSPWDLAATTRFQTEDGLVFRTPNAVRVPASRTGLPGTLDVAVVADEFDASGQVIGARGNIPPTKFSLPGLKNEENRKKLYGESRSPMTGGTTATTKSVTKEDIEAAREAVKREVTKGAVDDLKAYLEEQNLLKKTNLSLLTDRNVIKLSEPSVAVPADVLGKTMDQFEVTATYTLSGVSFDRLGLTDALKSRLMTRADPDKKIMKVEEDDISYKFLDEDANAGRIRLTATMRAIQVYELNPDKENGHRFLKKITDHILGMRVGEAAAYLQQQTDEISRVDITTWPIWAPTIPNIADNIKFVIREENDA